MAPHHAGVTSRFHSKGGAAREVRADRAHLVTMRAASVSSKKLLSIRERAMSGSAISFQSHTCADQFAA